MQAGDARDKPRLLNVSGGLSSACSLAQLSSWCSDRWGAQPVAHDPVPRQYDLTWVVLDAQGCTSSWSWQPQMDQRVILEEISVFAEAKPDWISLSA